MTDGGLPVRWHWAVAHALAIAVAVAFAFGHAERGGAAPILLAVAFPLALELSPLRADPVYGMWVVGTVAAAVALWRASEGIGVGPETFLTLLGAMTGGRFLLGLRRQGPSLYLLLLAVEVGLVAYFSGGQVSGGRMVQWLTDHGVSAASAQALTVAFRKTVHFTFYGLIGWSAYRAALAAASRSPVAVATGLLAAFSLAVFDELRQAGYASRTGSVRDVLLDLAGAAFFVGLSVLRRRAKR